MNNVICVYWGTKYPIKFVNILYSMCKRNISGKFNFYCLTDETNNAFNEKIIPIRIPDPQFDGWWNKMHLYDKRLGIEGNILYLDLDVCIISNLDDFFTQYREDDFLCIRDFGQPTTTINSSVQRYNLKHHSFIYDDYMKNKSLFDGMHGDQNVITDMMLRHKMTRILPDDWTYSFKWPDRGKPQKYEKYLPKKHPLKLNAKVCVFHGHPNPDYAMQYESGEWVKNYWK